jgi:Lrp/AsnC family transcriptional regulator for asnA, asnC and gidA
MSARKDALDSIERGIVRLLQEDGRMSTIELSRRLSASEPTIRKKLNRLIDDGIMSIRAVVDPSLLGYKVGAFIGLVVERGHIDHVSQLLSAYEFVDSVTITAGPNDITIKAYFETVDDVLNFVSKTLADVESIRDTDSTIIFREIKYFGLKGVVGIDIEDDGSVAVNMRNQS